MIRLQLILARCNQFRVAHPSASLNLVNFVSLTAGAQCRYAHAQDFGGGGRFGGSTGGRGAGRGNGGRGLNPEAGRGFGLNDGEGGSSGADGGTGFGAPDSDRGFAGQGGGRGFGPGFVGQVRGWQIQWKC